jgi:hypothetical protein
MTAALDRKYRTVLDEAHIQLLSLVVSAMRKSKGEEAHSNDVHDCRDVLFALTISGYAVIPQGAIDSLKEIFVNGDI